MRTTYRRLGNSLLDIAADQDPTTSLGRKNVAPFRRSKQEIIIFYPHQNDADLLLGSMEA